MAANVAGHVVMDMLRNEGQLFQKTHLAGKEELQKCWGRAAVAVHFFNDFTLKMFTVVGLQASIKNKCMLLC